MAIASSCAFGSAFAAPQASSDPAPVLETGDASSNEPTVLLDAWRARHGSDWRLALHPRTGSMEMLYGGSAEAPFELDTSSNEDWFRLALHWIEESRGFHGIEQEQLVNGTFRFLPLAQGNTTDKVTIRFEQLSRGGVPVQSSGTHVLFDALSGKLLAITTTAAPELEPEAPAYGGGFAKLIVANLFADEYGVEPTRVGDALLTHVRIDRGEVSTWQLCYVVKAEHEVDGDILTGQRYTLDAETRELLQQRSTVHNFDVFGTIRSNATPGTSADTVTNPPVPIPTPRVRVTSSAGTVVTDRDGNFNIVGVDTPVDLTVTYNGTFTTLDNQAGAPYSITFPNVQPNQQNDLLMNPNPTQFITSQANAQLHVNVLRDYIRDRFPTDTTADFNVTARVNIDQNCNATFSGNRINFYRAGNGCNNTAFSAIVAHEFGHWLNVLYDTNNGSDGMGEGNADVFAMYCYDDPVVGRFFTTGGGIVRTGTNGRQFCGDANPGCHFNGSPHRDGEVWMGAAWKVRTQLNNSLGNTMGDLQSDLLFLGWLNSFDQEDIRSIIEIQWLTLDDDNGTLEDGTPNYAAIDAGFRQQGFPGFDVPAVGILSATALDDTTDENGPYVIDAEVISNIAANVTGAEIRYSVSGGPLFTVPMANVSGNLYSGEIPGQTGPVLVEYYVEATDDQGNVRRFPAGAPAERLPFLVGDITVIADANFQAGASGFIGGAPGDTATTGLWVVGDPIGTAAQPATGNGEDGTNCWFTGQGSPGGGTGENDIDGGRTTLLSPPFDGGGAGFIVLEYDRWYSNDTGNAPNADVFDVDVTTDGGTTWTRIERVGPTGVGTGGGWFSRAFNLTDIVTPTNQMQIRWVASDEGTGSLVEAAVDNVKIIAVRSTTAAPVRNCVTTLNSTGNAARIFVTGSLRIPDNDFLVRSDNLPPGTFGLFFFGPGVDNAPLAGSQGPLCVMGPLNRLPVVQADPAFGTASYLLDFTDPQAPENQITAGSSWNFQQWFRDAGPGGPTSNTTDAILVTFGS